MNAIDIIAAVTQIVQAAATLIPQIETDIAAAKQGLSTTDVTAAQAQIDALHAESLALTAKLDAMKTPAAT